MRWRRPWQIEKRESQPYTEAITTALVNAASGRTTATAATTAALESCAALYAAAFAMARVVDAGPAAPSLSPSRLALMARDCIRRGESIHAIAVSDTGLELIPAGSWDVRGNWRESSWFYRCDLFGPSGNITRLLPSASVIHIRYSIDPARPWLGVSPLGWASSTGALAGRLERGLADESAAPSAQLLPVPQDGGDGDEDTDPLAKLKADIGNARGGALLVETTSAGWGEGQGGAPQRDWRQARVGPDWPDVLRETRSDAFDAVAGACNVPAVLLDKKSEGTSQREGLRRFPTPWRRAAGRDDRRRVGRETGRARTVLRLRRDPRQRHGGQSSGDRNFGQGRDGSAGSATQGRTVTDWPRVARSIEATRARELREFGRKRTRMPLERREFRQPRRKSN